MGQTNFRDKIISSATLKIPWKQRFQILITGKVHIRDEILTENIVGWTVGNVEVITDWPRFWPNHLDMSSTETEGMERVRQVIED